MSNKLAFLSPRSDRFLRASLLVAFVAALAVGGLAFGRTTPLTATQAPGAPLRQPHQIQLVLPTSNDPTARPRIRVEIPGRQPFDVDGSQPVQIELVSGRAVLQFQYPAGLRLSASVLATDTTLQLPDVQSTRVEVRNSRSLGISDAVLEARGGAGRFAWTNSLRTSSQGVGVLTHPANGAGPVVLVVQAAGYGPFREEVTITGVRDLSVPLEATGSISGTVSAPRGVSAQTRLQLWENSHGRREVRRVTASGPFTLAELPAGTYELAAVVPGSGALSVQAIALRPGDHLDVGVLNIATRVSLTGEVRRESGKPAGGLRVRLAVEGLSGRDVPEVYTDKNGRFQFRQLLPGEYAAEFYSPTSGWLSSPNGTLLIHGDEPVVRTFEVRPSDCSLRIELAGTADGSPSGYSIDLPTTDGSIQASVSRQTEERYFPSVPCTGLAVVQPTGREGERYSVPLEPGEARLSVPLEGPTTAREVVLTVGGEPLSGASLWATIRNSSQTVTKSRSSNVTDDRGHAMVKLPREDDITMYVQWGRLLAVVEQAQLHQNDGSLSLNLPNRVLQGIAADKDGKGIGGVSISGHRLPDFTQNSDNGLPASMVTVFKGVTSADGVFEVPGLAFGRWAIAFTLATAQPPESHSAEIELKPSSTGATRLDVNFERR